MSWHGPSAPRVEGIATKSFVVASCASKPASTASRIFRWVSLTFIASLFPFCAASQRPRRLDQTILCRDLQRSQIAFRIEPAPIHSRRNFAACGDTDARQPQCLVSHHRRADRGGGCARLQSLPDQEGTGGPADQCRSERTEDTEQMRQAVPPIMKASYLAHQAFLVSAAWQPCAV